MHRLGFQSHVHEQSHADTQLSGGPTHCTRGRGRGRNARGRTLPSGDRGQRATKQTDAATSSSTAGIHQGLVGPACPRNCIVAACCMHKWVFYQNAYLSTAVAFFLPSSHTRYI